MATDDKDVEKGNSYILYWEHIGRDYGKESREFSIEKSLESKHSKNSIYTSQK